MKKIFEINYLYHRDAFSRSDFISWEEFSERFLQNYDKYRSFSLFFKDPDISMQCILVYIKKEGDFMVGLGRHKVKFTEAEFYKHEYIDVLYNTMKNIKLDEKERKILEDFENRKTVKVEEDLAEYVNMAKNTKFDSKHSMLKK